MRKTDYKTMRFLVYMYYTYSCYQTSILVKIVRIIFEFLR